MIFKKFEFTDQAAWETVRATLYTPTEDGEVLIPQINAIHEIGFICIATDDEGECIDLSTKYAVDMLLNEEYAALDDNIVYPNPCGIHTFAGCEGEYLKSFCLANPDSEYCVIDETIF
jgi:hypothetical protein